MNNKLLNLKYALVKDFCVMAGYADNFLKCREFIAALIRELEKA